MVGKQQNILRLLPWLPAMLIFSTTASVEAQNVDPRIERVRQDLGYYQSREQQNSEDLKVEIRASHEEFRQTLERQNSRIQRIEEAALKLKAGEDAARQPLPQAKSVPAEPPIGAAMLTVCSQGCDFNDLQKAVDATAPGGEINVAPEINGTCAVINKSIHIIGKRGSDGRRAHLAGGVCNGRAPLVTAAGNIVIEGFEISGVSVSNGNGACIRLDPGTQDLTVRDIYCHDSQEGVLGASDGHFLIEDSVFIDNGFDNGQSHGLYIGGDAVLIRRCRILSTQNAGHSLKSGARKLTVEDSIIAALNGHNSRALDVYSGGEVELLRNVIQQGPQSENSDIIGLALESQRLQPDNHSLRLENNWVIFDNPGQGVLIRGRKLGPITAHNNTFIGLKGMGLDGVQDIDNHWFESRKLAGLAPFDGTSSSLPASAAKQ